MSAAFTEVGWHLPGEDEKTHSSNALLALQSVQSAVKRFDRTFDLRNEDREFSIPLFGADELAMSSSKVRSIGYYAEFQLNRINIIMDLHQGDFGTPAEEARNRFAERSEGNFYAIKYLQDGLIDSDHGPGAACDMIVETKILMNMAPHPNISQVYGVNMEGIDSFLSQGKRSFFFITDRIDKTLSERIQEWKDGKGYSGDDLEDKKKEEERLEIALDISAALVFLHDRSLVFYVRPDKVGFDVRYGRVKLCNFSQARQDGMSDHARSITKSDDIKTLAYTAPEVLCKSPTTISSDVYGFGIMLWEIFGLSKPFEGYDRSAHFDDVVKCSQRPTIMPTWPQAIRELIKECWHPRRRPNMKLVNESLELSLMGDLGGPNPLQKAKEEFTEGPKPTVERNRGPRERTDGRLSSGSDRSSSSRRGGKSPSRKRSNSDHGKSRSKTPTGRSIRSKSPSQRLLRSTSSISTSGITTRSKTPSDRCHRSNPNLGLVTPEPSSGTRSKTPTDRHHRSNPNLGSRTPTRRKSGSHNEPRRADPYSDEDRSPKKASRRRSGSHRILRRAESHSDEEKSPRKTIQRKPGAHDTLRRLESQSDEEVPPRKASRRKSGSHNGSRRSESHSDEENRGKNNEHGSKVARRKSGTGRSNSNNRTLTPGRLQSAVGAERRGSTESGNASRSPTSRRREGSQGLSSLQRLMYERSNSFNASTTAQQSIRSGLSKQKSLTSLAIDRKTDERSLGSADTGPTVPDVSNSDESTPPRTPRTPKRSVSASGRFMPTTPQGSSLDPEWDPFHSPGKTPPSGRRAGFTRQHSYTRRNTRTSQEHSPGKQKPGLPPASPLSGAFSSPKAPASPTKQRQQHRQKSQAKKMQATLEALRKRFTANGFDNIPNPSPSDESPPRLNQVSPRQLKRATQSLRNIGTPLWADGVEAQDSPKNQRKNSKGPPLTRLNQNPVRRTSFT